jgi:hypothetical protein
MSAVTINEEVEERRIRVMYDVLHIMLYKRAIFHMKVIVAFKS